MIRWTETNRANPAPNRPRRDNKNSQKMQIVWARLIFRQKNSIIRWCVAEFPLAFGLRSAMGDLEVLGAGVGIRPFAPKVNTLEFIHD